MSDDSQLQTQEAAATEQEAAEQEVRELLAAIRVENRDRYEYAAQNGVRIAQTSVLLARVESLVDAVLGPETEFIRAVFELDFEQRIAEALKSVEGAIEEAKAAEARAKLLAPFAPPQGPRA